MTEMGVEEWFVSVLMIQYPTTVLSTGLGCMGSHCFSPYETRGLKQAIKVLLVREAWQK